jgi:hypothetical protein
MLAFSNPSDTHTANTHTANTHTANTTNTVGAVASANSRTTSDETREMDALLISLSPDTSSGGGAVHVNQRTEGADAQSAAAFLNTAAPRKVKSDQGGVRFAPNDRAHAMAGLARAASASGGLATGSGSAEATGSSNSKTQTCHLM